MSADRWRQAKLHEALEVLLARHRENFSPAEVREVEQAILALREAEHGVQEKAAPASLELVSVPRKELQTIIDSYEMGPEIYPSTEHCLEATIDKVRAMLVAAEEEHRRG